MEDNIRLIALDMDGTLLKNESEISEENKRAIERAKDAGIHVIVSTGRPIGHCRSLVRSLGDSEYIVTVNGGEIYDGDFNLVTREVLGMEEVKRLWEIQREYGVRLWTSTVEGAFDSDYKFEKPIEEYEWLKIGLEVPDEDVRNVILKEVTSNPALEVTNSSPVNIEINPAGVSKAAALHKISGLLGFSLNEVMAVGDSLNDLAMIKEAGIGVAMGNAQEEVKQEADLVTETNVENGVASVINRVVDAKAGV
ncbi:MULTISPECIES: Cof-type HAD-IIB family hydrolase [Salimicrobium]|uniref:Phosphoglycolate phosphatase n=1 Tax=Salimicrobium humidisoli TaxID=2029857 RepID=A0ABX4HVG3_9BACI|nr:MULTISPECIES: Cof-type HAD-IIB family hydrolase [Salimicrobium]PBB07098.1 phosphoglycolate phosphatase [Salimicrobium humidisoli]